MPLLQVSHLTKRYGATELFSDLSFCVEKGDKIALIAPNGAGKTTLLRILVGEESAQEGEVIYTNGTRVGYLPQTSSFEEYPHILAACMSGIEPRLQEVIAQYEEAVLKGDAHQISYRATQMDALQAWDVEREIISLLDRMDLTDPMRSPKGLSGGEMKKIAIASVLISQPDILLLDEPTNHLDPDVIEWLEEYLSTSTLTLVMVTHDRYFLDVVSHTILELHQRMVYRYEGNYTRYLQKKQERESIEQKEQQSLRNLYRRELEWMQRMPQARATKAKYRIDAFEKTKEKLCTATQQPSLHLAAETSYIGKKIFEAKGVYKSYAEKAILKDFSYVFARKDRVGIVGANGVGKTTLIRILLGEEEPDRGQIEVGETVRWGYFSQNSFEFRPGQKVIEALTEQAEHFDGYEGARVSAMQMLNRFLFPPARQQDYIENLSGGERRRLQLCKVLVEKPNFLVLDEPTNDLDIPTLRVLEDYLKKFDGCLLVVSHDRYFMDNLVDHLLVMEGEGEIKDYPGNYTDYRRSKKELQEREKRVSKQTPSVEDKGYKKERPKTKRTYSEEQEYKALEDEIKRLQDELLSIETKMSSGDSAASDLLSMAQRYTTLKEILDEKEMRWLTLSEWD